MTGPRNNSLLALHTQMHSLSSQSRSQFSCSACDRSFSLLSSLLTHQHSHTPEQRLLAEAEAEIVCPPSLSLSLPLPSSPDKPQDGKREAHAGVVAASDEREEVPVKLVKNARKGSGCKSATSGGKSNIMSFVGYTQTIESKLSKMMP